MLRYSPEHICSSAGGWTCKGRKGRRISGDGQPEWKGLKLSHGLCRAVQDTALHGVNARLQALVAEVKHYLPLPPMASAVLLVQDQTPAASEQEATAPHQQGYSITTHHPVSHHCTSRVSPAVQHGKKGVSSPLLSPPAAFQVLQPPAGTGQGWGTVLGASALSILPCCDLSSLPPCSHQRGFPINGN